MTDATPGPWCLTTSAATGATFVRAANQSRRSLAVATVHRRGAEKLANARLIAAAPEMLETLRENLSNCACVKRLEWCANCERAEYAISLAENGQADW